MCVLSGKKHSRQAKRAHQENTLKLWLLQRLLLLMWIQKVQTLLNRSHSYSSDSFFFAFFMTLCVSTCRSRESWRACRILIQEVGFFLITHINILPCTTWIKWAAKQKYVDLLFFLLFPPHVSFSSSLRDLRQNVARLLANQVPALGLDQVNYDCNVIDELFDQYLKNQCRLYVD